MIETDAAVNPGSDGGALTDADGNLGRHHARWVFRVRAGWASRIPISRMRSRCFRTCERNRYQHVVAARADRQLARTSGLSGLAFCRTARNGREFDSCRLCRSDEATRVCWQPEKRGAEELAPRDAYPEGEERAKFETKRPSGSASAGFIVDADGTVLTSAALLNGNLKNVFVYLPDGTRVEAKLMGKDDFFDAAVLKFDATPAMKLKASNGRCPSCWRKARHGRGARPQRTAWTHYA